MSYFPLFVDLQGKRCLVVGGGRVALRKVRTLLEFRADITVAAPDICSEIKSLSEVSLIEAEYTDSLLDGAFLVIAASDSDEVNSLICRKCQERNIPVNSAAGKKEGSFIFPSVIKRGDLTVGVSTGGTSPGAAAELRKSIEAVIPESIEEILLSMNSLRAQVLSCVEPSLRGSAMRQLYLDSVTKGSSLTEEEASLIIKDYVMRGHK